MPGPGTSKKFPQIDLAYLAGLLDGEGTVTAHLLRDGRVDVQVFITNSDRGVLEWVKTNFLGSIHRHTRSGFGKKDCWRWFSRRDDELFAALLPYLKIKRSQMEVALAILAVASRRDGRRGYLKAQVIIERREGVSHLQALNRGAA